MASVFPPGTIPPLRHGLPCQNELAFTRGQGAAEYQGLLGGLAHDFRTITNRHDRGKHGSY